MGGLAGTQVSQSACQNTNISRSEELRTNAMSGSAVLKCFKTWLTSSDQSYTNFITAVTVVRRASSPYVLTRFGELGSLEEVISQRFDYGDDGRLRPSPADGKLDQKGAGTPVSSKQMMISTITMAVGDADGDWKAAEDILAENCVAYGLQGKTTILQAKKENFSKNLPGSGTAYEVNNFLCDPDNRMISFTFQCFLRGEEGRGTEMVFF